MRVGVLVVWQRAEQLSDNFDKFDAVDKIVCQISQIFANIFLQTMSLAKLNPENF